MGSEVVAFSERTPVNLVDHNDPLNRLESEGLAGGRRLCAPRTVRIPPPQIERRRSMRDEETLLEGWDLFVVFELLASVPILSAVAQDFDNQVRVQGDHSALGILLDGAIDDADVWVADQPRGQNANLEIRAEDPAGAITELPADDCGQRSCQRGVFGRTAGHRVDLTVEKLVLRVAALLVGEEVSECVAMVAMRRLIHAIPRIPRPLLLERSQVQCEAMLRKHLESRGLVVGGTGIEPATKRV